MKNVGIGRRRENLLLNYVVLILAVLSVFGPLYILVGASLKTKAEMRASPLGLPPVFRIGNYAEAWVTGQFGRTMLNSLVYAACTVVGVLVFGGMAAYALARLKPRGGRLYMMYTLGLTTMPIWLYIVPLFVNWRILGLLNTRLGVIIIYIARFSPFAIFLLRSFLMAIPDDFEDVARVDGANEWQVFSRVIAPMMAPGFLTVGLIVALNIWGEFQVALTFVHEEALMPVATSYFKFQRRFDYDMTLASAGAVMMIVPVAIVFLSLQRRFVAGLTQGGVR